MLPVRFELGAALACDSQLLGGVGCIFVDTVLGWYRRRLAERGVAGAHSGSITIIQRLQSDLRLNPHQRRQPLGIGHDPEETDPPRSSTWRSCAFPRLSRL